MAYITNSDFDSSCTIVIYEDQNELLSLPIDLNKFSYRANPFFEQSENTA